MPALREAVVQQMRLRGFSPRTHESYIHTMEELARFYKRPLDTLTCPEVQAFLDHLISVRKLAWATINVYFSAYRFLYEQVLNWDRKAFSIPPRGRSGRRPGILSREEVTRLIEKGTDIYSIKRCLGHTAILTTARYMHVTPEHRRSIVSPADTLN